MERIRTQFFELAANIKGNKDSKKLALALPGRLDTKDYACFTSHIEYLARKGFLAVSFDPPGTWESPGGIELFTTTNYIKAVNELIEYFGNKPTFLLGHSRGGTVAILAGASNQAVIGFAPIMATYSEPTPSHPEAETMKNGVKMSYRDLPPGTSKTSEQKEFALPINYFKDMERHNVVEVLKKCTKPKLIFYGTQDEFTETERVKEVFKVIPEPKILHELESNHDYRYHQRIIDDVSETIGHFLDKYFKE